MSLESVKKSEKMNSHLECGSSFIPTPFDLIVSQGPPSRTEAELDNARESYALCARYRCLGRGFSCSRKSSSLVGFQPVIDSGFGPNGVHPDQSGEIQVA